MDDFQFYALLITLTLILYAWLFTSKPKPTKRLPPSPPTLPIIGNLHQLGHLAHRALHGLSRTYGPTMLLKFGSKPVLVISSAEAAREVMRTHDLSFAGKPVLSAPSKLFYDLNDPINMQYGDRWRGLRRIFVHELLGPARVHSFDSIREAEVSLLVERMSRPGPVDLSAEFMTLANGLICRAAFGKKHMETSHGENFLEVMDRAVGLMFNFTLGEFVPWLAWINGLNGFNAALDKCARELDEIMSNVVRDHLEKESGEKENFMDILLGIYKGEVSGMSIDLISVKAVITDVLGAGTETSARTLTWVMTELIRHPHVMKRLQDEVRGITKGKKGITEDDIKRMSYLKAVIKETFRAHPPVAIYFHAAREHVNFMGYDIEPETMVLINAWAIGQDPTCWQEPERFMPERFLDSTVDFRGFDFELIPFGAGRRICPGIGFAAAAIEHTVANLVKNFDFELPGGA
ncbi:cytochrome P450, partial [Striga asiatica]